MTENVTLKSYKNGLRVKLNPDVPFDLLLAQVSDKFTKASSFFKNASVALSFEGRLLTEEETDQLVDIIKKSCNLDVSCIVCLDDELEEYYAQLLTRLSVSAIEMEGLSSFRICDQTLNDGDTFRSSGNVLVIGDVNKGAVVTANGDVYVLGTVYGSVFAGIDKNRDHHIYAGGLQAEIIKIADLKLEKNKNAKFGLLKKPRLYHVYAADNELITEAAIEH
ncbi:MAG: hypothetical protein K6G07_05225 [Lachnospiraceae bacterium]|nr:hypothetical protein [Lachnospiraceae bacterium]